MPSWWQDKKQPNFSQDKKIIKIVTQLFPQIGKRRVLGFLLRMNIRREVEIVCPVKERKNGFSNTLLYGLDKAKSRLEKTSGMILNKNESQSFFLQPLASKPLISNTTRMCVNGCASLASTKFSFDARHYRIFINNRIIQPQHLNGRYTVKIRWTKVA